MGQHQLILMRHAEAQEGAPDRERVLTERGVQQAIAAAHFMQQQKLMPELVLASAAKRTQQTAELVMTQFGLAPDLLELRMDLYGAKVSDLLVILAGAVKQKRHILLVGHNPSITELADFLLDQSLPRLEPSHFNVITVSDIDVAHAKGIGQCKLTYDR